MINTNKEEVIHNVMNVKLKEALLHIIKYSFVLNDKKSISLE